MDQGRAMLVREISPAVHNAAVQDAVATEEHYDTARSIPFLGIPEYQTGEEI